MRRSFICFFGGMRPRLPLLHSQSERKMWAGVAVSAGWQSSCVLRLLDFFVRDAIRRVRLLLPWSHDEGCSRGRHKDVR